MNKIKFELYDRIIEDKSLTSDEISMIFYIAKYADDEGNCPAVYYKNAANELGISVSQFYIIIKNLKAKKFISVSKEYRYDIDIILHSNNFYERETAEFKNYVNINIKAFNKSFYSFKSGEKKLLMLLIKNTLAKKGKVTKKHYEKIYYIPENEYKIYSKKLCCTRRTIKKYIDNLKEYITIQHRVYEVNKDRFRDILIINKIKYEQEKIKYNDNNKEKYRDKPNRFDSDRHFLAGYCRRNGIEYEDEELDGTAMLITQYEKSTNARRISARKIIIDAIDRLPDSFISNAAINKIVSVFIKNEKNKKEENYDTYINKRKSTFMQRTYDNATLEKELLKKSKMKN